MKPAQLAKAVPLKTFSWKRAPDPNSRREMSRLTPEEESSVRVALEVLRAQHGGEWKAVAAALKSNKRTLTKLLCFERRITATYALRVARLLGESLGDGKSSRCPARRCRMISAAA